MAADQDTLERFVEKVTAGFEGWLGDPQVGPRSRMMGPGYIEPKEVREGTSSAQDFTRWFSNALRQSILYADKHLDGERLGDAGTRCGGSEET